ncbi:hypothetical protein [Sinomicrobium weinanense]|uniref:Acyloxyacyl hydrolase n=1 Tax=Sinomicrobium weinanense TaxID=2842200 RepID=A0A926JRP7_9FLAO|nr:hypothetical protein [Sinomicrobium weinanense]MBC9796144.1 hypothetical protein [Sinomicrobium weinanense]MBU3121895.1 hypothetical protein [Sinomicrobium weinanense]
MKHFLLLCCFWIATCAVITAQTTIKVPVENTIKTPTDDSIVIRSDHSFKEWTAIAGIRQWDHTFIELGAAYMAGNGSRCAFGYRYYGIGLSADYNPFDRRGGLHLSGWTNGFMGLIVGGDINTYTDFHSYNLGLKPFIGLDWERRFTLTYGYNFQVVDNNLSGINGHVLSLQYRFSLKSSREKI